MRSLRYGVPCIPRTVAKRSDRWTLRQISSNMDQKYQALRILSRYTTVSFLSETQKKKNVQLCQNNKQRNHIGLGESDQNGPLQYRSSLRWIHKHRVAARKPFAETSHHAVRLKDPLAKRSSRKVRETRKHLMFPVSLISESFHQHRMPRSQWNVALSMGSAICCLNVVNTGW